MNILEVAGLSKHYPSFDLKEVSFNLVKGSITGFIGRNGAGKSTTLNCLLNYVHPNKGTIRFFDKDFIENEKEIKTRLGFVSSGVNYYPSKKLAKIAKVTSMFYENWDNRAFLRYMEMFSLSLNKTPAQLSAGMKVKFALALALSHNADLLILDEPTSGLDPVSRDDLLDVLLALREEGKTILFSTHITSDLEKCADNIIYIKQGQIVAEKSIKDFEDAYRLAELSREEDLARFKPIAKGLRRTKEGYTALVETKDFEEGQKADLETIMVHLEKETGNV